MLYKAVLTFESLDEILKCDHSNESYLAALSCGAVYYAVQGGSNFWIFEWNPKVWSIQMKATQQYFNSCGSVKRADKILEGNKWKQQQKSLLFVSGSSYKFVPTKQEDQRNKTFLIDSACKRLFYL